MFIHSSKVGRSGDENAFWTIGIAIYLKRHGIVKPRRLNIDGSKSMKIRFQIIFWLLSFSSLGNATALSQSCNVLGQIKAEMDVVAANLANWDTTRTPEGGPYREKRYKCDSGKCKVEIVNEGEKLVYEPSHVDANEQGYVKYPNFDIGQQTAEMRLLIKEYDRAIKICLKRE
jgi:flagellar basal-body rod protein FlgC